uniref:Chemokine interleukin-8-like domain-containing protein n=1 Tax=Oreochromis niloticus TaxID=8128 RepID=I3JXT8_ORENI
MYLYFKNSPLAAVVALKHTLCLSLTASGMGLVPPDLCCFKFFDKRIPKVHILSIRKTHSKCLTEAFVYKSLLEDITEEWRAASPQSGCS